MSQSSTDNFNSTLDAIRLVEQYERDEALARQLQNGAESDSETPGPSSSRTVIGRSIRITTDLPAIDEDVIDLTVSGDEDDEDESNESMDTSHNTTAESSASNAQIESDEAMARRLMQEMVEEENERDRSPIIRHIRPRRTASGTSGRGRSRTLFRWNANEHRRNAMPSPPRRHPDDLPVAGEEEDTEEALFNESNDYDIEDSFINDADASMVATNNRVRQAPSYSGANNAGPSSSVSNPFRPPAFTRQTVTRGTGGPSGVSNLLFSMSTSSGGGRSATSSMSIVRGGPGSGFPLQGSSYERLLNLQDHKVGLRQDQINRLPSQSLDETLAGDTCPVCMDEMATNNEVRRLPCLHVLHKGCIDPWLKNSKECPICKFDISSAM